MLLLNYTEWMLYLQNPPAGYLAVSKGHPGDAAPVKYKYGKYNNA